jgi:hypothetical protein
MNNDSENYRIGMYDHLDPIIKNGTKIDLDDFAATLIKNNYGVHRFFSALIRQRKILKGGLSPIIDKIEEMIKEGHFN